MSRLACAAALCAAWAAGSAWNGPGWWPGPRALAGPPAPAEAPPRIKTPRPKPPDTNPAAPVPAGGRAPATAPRPAPASAPAVRPARVVLPPEALDLRVERAVRRGLDYLYGVQQADGSWDSKYASQHAGGVEALVVWTALLAGEDHRQPHLLRSLGYLAGLDARTVYVRAARALAYSRLPAGEFGSRLQEDVEWLVRYQLPVGGWGYGPGYRTTRENPGWTDNSNTFLAMLALRDAADAGIDVPSTVWTRLRIHWSRTANADGGISYQPPGGPGFRLRGSSYGSMTAAGLNAMLLLTDKWAALNEAPFTNTGERRANPSPYQATIDRALAWLGQGLALDKNPKWVWGAGEAYEYYYLWCLQQFACEGGLDRVGAGEVMRPAVELILSRQKPTGSWDDPAAPGAEDSLQPIRTCFALLALLRARGPVIIQRLALADGTPNDARDAANLARWTGRAFRWPAAWRALAPDAPAEEFARAPVLYVHAAVKDYPAGLDEKLRACLAAGGTVVVQPFAGDAALLAAARDYLVKAFPALTTGDVPDSHPIYAAHFKIPVGGRPRLFGLGDTCRMRIFLFTTDVSGAWHQDRSQEHAQLFQLGANLLLYTTDLLPPKGRFRTEARHVRPPAPARAISVARVKHAGDWNVFPQAVGSVSDVLAEALSLGVHEAPAVDLSQPVPSSVPLLWLTGTRDLKLTASQTSALRDYLGSGGTLLIDPAMGGKPFHDAAAAMLGGMFGAGSLQAVSADHPLLTGAFAGGIGSDVTKVRLTRAAAAETGDDLPPTLSCVSINGRIAVVLSPLSLVCPLAGQPVYNCRGLVPADAARLAANVLLYAATRSAGN